MIFWPKKMQLLRWLPDSVVLTRGSRHDKAIYLSFDDGPDPQFTPALLDLLQANGAQASFFLIGQQVERHPQIVERMVAEGHRLGNHSYSHPMFNTLSAAEKLDEIDRTDKLLERFDGCARHRFRPPRGAFSWPLTLLFARHRRNMTYWSYDSLDYQQRPPVELVERMRLQPPGAGELILMHDDSDCSTRMLETLLPEWRQQGFRFSALSA